MRTIQTFQEKIEMIAQLTAGNKVKFQYVKARNRNYDTFPCTTSYEVEAYEGNVLEVRDIVTQKLDKETVYRRPEIERSQFLLVVQTPDNKIKSFYDGRIINLEEIKAVPKSFLRRTLDKLKVK
jgi:hypothetical protein